VPAIVRLDGARFPAGQGRKTAIFFGASIGFPTVRRRGPAIQISSTELKKGKKLGDADYKVHSRRAITSWTCLTGKGGHRSANEIFYFTEEHAERRRRIRTTLKYRFNRFQPQRAGFGADPKKSDWPILVNLRPSNPFRGAPGLSDGKGGSSGNFYDWFAYEFLGASSFVAAGKSPKAARISYRVPANAKKGGQPSIWKALKQG